MFARLHETISGTRYACPSVLARPELSSQQPETTADLRTSKRNWMAFNGQRGGSM